MVRRGRSRQTTGRTRVSLCTDSAVPFPPTAMSGMQPRRDFVSHSCSTSLRENSEFQHPWGCLTPPLESHTGDTCQGFHLAELSGSTSSSLVPLSRLPAQVRGVPSSLPPPAEQNKKITINVLYWLPWQ